MILSTDHVVDAVNWLSGTKVISLQSESQRMLSLLLWAHVCLPLYVYAPCVKACELEHLTELYKCRKKRLKKPA